MIILYHSFKRGFDCCFCAWQDISGASTARTMRSETVTCHHCGNIYMPLSSMTHVNSFASSTRVLPEAICFVNTHVLSSSQLFFRCFSDDANLCCPLPSSNHCHQTNMFVFYQEAFPHVPEPSSIPWISLLYRRFFIHISLHDLSR